MTETTDSSLPSPENMNLPQLLKERQQLVDQLAGTFAIPIYSRAHHGTAVTNTHHPGEDHTTYNHLNQSTSSLEGVIMPLNSNHSEFIIIAANSLELALIKQTDCRKLYTDSLSQKATFDDLQQGITLTANKMPTLAKNLTRGLEHIYQITDSSTNPDLVNQKLETAIKFSQQEQHRLLTTRSIAAQTAHTTLSKLLEPPLSSTPNQSE